MDRDKALSKIKKCLALSRSANENEAAAALRQAQALMAEHGLGEADVALSDIGESRAPARSPAINAWESRLAHLVGEAFGCEHLSVIRYLPGGRAFLKRARDVVFIGANPAPEVASYAYKVLSRKCAAARLAYIAKQPRTCKPITKTARGDEFAQGWVIAVRDLVQRFAGRQADTLLIEAYMQRHFPNVETVRPVNKAVGRNVRSEDRWSGFEAGKNTRLEQALPGQQGVGLLGVGAAQEGASHG